MRCGRYVTYNPKDSFLKSDYTGKASGVSGCPYTIAIGSVWSRLTSNISVRRGNRRRKRKIAMILSSFVDINEM